MKINSFICGFSKETTAKIRKEYPKAVGMVEQYLKDSIPKENLNQELGGMIEKLMGGLAAATMNVDCRKLYDFFDLNRIHLGIVTNYDGTVNATVFDAVSGQLFSTSPSLGDEIDLLPVQRDYAEEDADRIKKELSAFYKAFELLEKRHDK